MKFEMVIFDLLMNILPDINLIIADLFFFTLDNIF